MRSHTHPPAHRGARRALLALFGLLIAVFGAIAPAPPAAAEDPTEVLFLLDVSGSMNGKIASGGTKFAAAQRALKRVADAVPAGTQVGLRVYGSQIVDEQDPKACTDTKLVLPIGPLDRSRLFRAVDSFKAKGSTPIAYSLGKAVDDLGPSGKRVLILISDGEESCDGDPCPAARRLARNGVDLQFNAIGLAVGAKARRQLQCIAKAGDGDYYDAGNTTDLEEAVRKITQRALRPFQISGTPVQGTPDQAAGPVIGPGQYKDRYDASNTPRYYRLRRSTPGSTLTASVTSIVRPYPSQNREFWNMALTTPDGTRCADANPTTDSFRATRVVAGAVQSSQTRVGFPTSPPEVCATSPELLLSLARQSPLGNEDITPVEVVISEEPPIANLAALPDAVTDYTGKGDAVRPAGPGRPILGGTSFSNASEMAPGTWRDSVAVGESVLYKVRLEPGQRFRVSAETPAPKTGWRLTGADAVLPRIFVYSPARVQLSTQDDALFNAEAKTLTVASPQVRVRNREVPPPDIILIEPNVTTASIAGDYYVGLQLDPSMRYLSGRVMQVRLSLAVDGQPTGPPEYAVPSLNPTPSPTDATDSAPPTVGPSTPSVTPGTPSADGGSGLAPGVLLAGAGVLAVGLVAGALAITRRRRRRPDASATDSEGGPAA